MMIDYKNGMDISMTYPIIYNSKWFVLIACIYNGNIFTSIPVDSDNIDTDVIK